MKFIVSIFLLFQGAICFADTVLLSPGEVRRLGGHEVACGKAGASRPVAKYCECRWEDSLFGSGYNVSLNLVFIDANGQKTETRLYGMNTNDPYALQRECESSWKAKYGSACF